MPDPTETPPPTAPQEEAQLGPLAFALRAMSDEAAEGTREDRPLHLPLADIELCEDAFNVRGEELSEHHLSDLARALKSAENLEPVTVLACGQQYLLVDGHHRLKAYRRAKRGTIPVRYFEGTPEEAVLEACRANASAVLPMDNRQRQNLAWRLVVAGLFSKKVTAASAGVSPAQVSTMRKVKRTLGEEAFEIAQWWQAKRAAERNDDEEDPTFTEEDREVWIEEQAQKYADRMAKEFSTKLAKNPEVAARALEYHLGRKLPEVLRFLRDHDQPAIDDEDDEEDDF